MSCAVNSRSLAKRRMRWERSLRWSRLGLMAQTMSLMESTSSREVLAMVESGVETETFPSTWRRATSTEDSDLREAGSQLSIVQISSDMGPHPLQFQQVRNTVTVEQKSPITSNKYCRHGEKPPAPPERRKNPETHSGRLGAGHAAGINRPYQKAISSGARFA